jgi:hypothetical protein
MHLVACGVAVAALGGVALAQAPAALKPGPEHKAMAFFAGRWTSQGELKPGPLGPGGKTTGTDTCEWFAGGFQIVCRGQGKGPMGSMTSLGVMAYDAAKKAYTYYGVDSHGMNELSTGTKSGDTWTFTATSTYGGQTFQSRYTIVETSPTSYTFTWESSPDGTKWSTLMEGKATKATKTTTST